MISAINLRIEMIRLRSRNINFLIKALTQVLENIQNKRYNE